MRLDLAQQNLSHKLTQALNGDEEFLVHAEQHIERLAIPLDEFMIQSEKRRKTTIQDSGTGTGSSDNAENGDGERNVELKTVCELVADATEQTRAFEKEMEELWREWVVAEKEARRLMRRVGEPGAGSEGGELLKRYTAAVEKEIAKAEEEVTNLGGEAVKMMKEIEKVSLHDWVLMKFDRLTILRTFGRRRCRTCICSFNLSRNCRIVADCCSDVRRTCSMY
jgi:hypothetical protein